MHLERLQDFIAVATHLHFGRAALARGMDQSALSRSVRRLEESLGAELFERTSRRVVLTPAGTAFLPDARRLLLDMARAERTVQQIAAGDQRPLRVGFASPATFGPLPRATQDFAREHPGVELQLQELYFNSGAERLHNSEIDLCFIVRARNDREGLDGLATQAVQQLRYQAALPVGWPQSRRRQMQLRDLAGLPMILPPRRHAAQLYDAIFLACADAGFVPHVLHEVWQTVTMLSFVAAGIGAALIVDSGRTLGFAGARFVQLSDLPDYLDMELLAVWHPRLNTAPLQGLINAMKTG